MKGPERGAECFGIIQAWFEILFALMAIYCIFNIPQCTAELYGAAESIFVQKKQEIIVGFPLSKQHMLEGSFL